MEDQKRIVEINGVKVEVDLRTAKRVDEFKVGDRVKLLVKGYSDYKSCYGVIIGFDEFKKLPTLIVAYIDDGYSADIKTAYINAESKDLELCHISEGDFLNLKASDVLAKLNRDIEKHERDIEDLKAKIEFFNRHMNHTFKLER